MASCKELVGLAEALSAKAGPQVRQVPRAQFAGTFDVPISWPCSTPVASAELAF
jgi:hypothetical protein